jgi:hypothetical protein
MTFTLTREQLYDLVWSEPMQRLAKQIGISDVAIAKHCRKLGVPVPERGYWNKLQARKPVTKTALPERDLVTINLVTISGTLTPELKSRIKGEPGIAVPSGESIEALAERLRKRLGHVTVPRKFSREHPTIAPLLRKDEKLRQEAANSHYHFPWNQPKFDTPFERRRLLFLNGLFLGFAKVGGRGWIRGNDARELAIYMGAASVSFQLEGPAQGRTTRPSSSTPSEAGEPMRLTISTAHSAPSGMPFAWRDEDGCKLEQQLTDVIVGMAVAGEYLHRKWLEEQAAWERRRQEEAEREVQRRKAEEERRKRERIAALEKAKRDALRGDARAWREAADIRAYVEAVRKAAYVPETTDAWARWALLEADRIDPIVSGRALQTTTEVQRMATVGSADNTLSQQPAEW